MPQVSITKSPSTVAKIGSFKVRAATVRLMTPLPSMTNPASTKTPISKPPPRKPCPRPRNPQLVARATIPKPMVLTSNLRTPVLKSRNATALESYPGNPSLDQQQNPAALVRGPQLILKPTGGTLPQMRPVLQYRKVSSQNRLQVGTTAELRPRFPPNAVPTSGSATQWSRSVTSFQTLNAQNTRPGHPTPRLTVPTAPLRSEHDKPLPSSSSGASTPASRLGSNTPVKQEPIDTPQVWAEAGLVSNSILSTELVPGTGSIFVKREVLEEEPVLPAGFKRQKLESNDLEVEQLLDHKDGSYLVKWAGLSKEQSTWEPAGRLSCAQLIHQYHTSK